MAKKTKAKAKRKVKKLEVSINTQMINFKASPQALKIFKARANKFYNGNVSEFLRDAGRHYQPVV